MQFPPEDLTQDRLEQWWALPMDRQRFVWALQTETRVRAHKVKQRDITHTLQSNLLFDIYLPPDAQLKNSGCSNSETSHFVIFSKSQCDGLWKSTTSQNTRCYLGDDRWFARFDTIVRARGFRATGPSEPVVL